MKNSFLLISCQCIVVLGTLRHSDCSTADSAAATTAAPAPAAYPSFAVRVVGHGPLLLSQYAGTPRLVLAMHPTAHHLLMDGAPAWCWQQLDQMLTPHYRPAPHPRA